MVHIAVLMTVYNRKETTLKCLAYFFDAIKLTPNIAYDVFLTDDASTDGTDKAIYQKFPMVNIIKSSGNLFWNRGMINAWSHACNKKQYDFFIWLNDDTFLYDKSVKILLDSSNKVNHMAIIGGALKSSVTNKTTYGGKINEIELSPNKDLQEFEQLNGNFVLIPKVVFDKIGMLDPIYHHAIGDYDYGFRARKKGIKLLLTPEYVGVCDRHDNIPKCYDSKYSIINRFRYLYSPVGPNPLILFKYYCQHYSWIKAFRHFLFSNLITFYPFFLKLKNK